MTPDLIVVGSGRCGTLSLATHLGGTHEPFKNPMVYLASAYAHKWISPTLAAGLIAREDWPEIVVDFKQSEVIEITSGLWPDCRYMWMLRNPADTIASMVAKRWYMPHDDNYPPGFITYHGTWTDKHGDTALLDAEVILYNNSGNRTRGDITGDFTVDEWSGMSQVERCAWWWAYVNSRIAVQLEQIPDRAEILRLEDHPELRRDNETKAKPVYGWESIVEVVAGKLGYDG